MSSLVVLSEEVLCLMKSISQFFLFGKSKNWSALLLASKSHEVLLRAFMECFSELTYIFQILKG